MVGGDFDVLVLLDVFEGLLEAEYHGRNDAGLVVGTACAHVGEFFRLGDVDDDVLVLGALAHDLSGVDLFLGEDEEAAAVLQLVDGVGVSRAAFHGDERAVGTTLDVAFPGLVLEEAVGHYGLAGAGGEDVVAQADDAAAGDDELHVRAVVLRCHVYQVALAAGYHVDHLRGIFLGDVDGEQLDGLALYAVDFFDDDLGLAHLQLVALAAHGLDKY